MNGCMTTSIHPEALADHSLRSGVHARPCPPESRNLSPRVRRRTVTARNAGEPRSGGEFSPVPAEFDTLIQGRPHVMVLTTTTTTTTTTGGPGPAGRPVQIATVP